jgi:hypothetical protein
MAVGEFGSFADFKEEVTRHDGVLTTTMEVLRDTYKAGRLGVHVRNAISNELAKVGLSHYPVELPIYYHEPVRVYQLGTPIAGLIDAVLIPSEEGDEQLRQATGGVAAEILQAVRALVC